MFQRGAADLLRSTSEVRLIADAKSAIGKSSLRSSGQRVCWSLRASVYRLLFMACGWKLRRAVVCVRKASVVSSTDEVSSSITTIRTQTLLHTQIIYVYVYFIYRYTIYALYLNAYM